MATLEFRLSGRDQFLIGYGAMDKDYAKGFQLGLVNKTTYFDGIRIGFVNLGKSRGLSVGVIDGISYSTTSNNSDSANSGLALSLFGSNYDRIKGVQISGLINRVLDSCHGVQASSFVNANEGYHCGLQASAMNYAKKLRGMQLGIGGGGNECYGLAANLVINRNINLKGMQVGAFNLLEDQGYGMQLGLFNCGGNPYIKNTKYNGVQAGVLNIVTDELNGFQIGLVSYAKDGNYLQIGAITIRGDGPWYTRVSPIIGWHRKKDKNIKDKTPVNGPPENKKVV